MIAETSPRKALLAGIGSPFGVDRLGWQALETLRQQGWTARYPAWQWQLTCLDRPGTTLLELMQDRQLVILLDAMQAEGGGPRLLSIDELVAEAAPLSGHGLGVADSLLLGRQLAMLPERLLIVGLPLTMALRFDGLTALLERALADA